MTTLAMMKRKKSILFLFVMIPSFLYAQDQVILNKIDSARKAFLKADSIRRKNGMDTIPHVFTASAYTTIFEPSPSPIIGPQQLSVKITGFRHDRFLEWLLKAGLPNPVIVSQESVLQLTGNDGTVIELRNMGRSVPKGNGKRSSKDLRLTCRIAQKDFDAMTKTRITTIRIAYDNGVWTVSLTPENAEKLRLLCASFR